MLSLHLGLPPELHHEAARLRERLAVRILQGRDEVLDLRRELAAALPGHVGHVLKEYQRVRRGGQLVQVHALFVELVEELLEEIKKYPAEQVYCIGGDSVYKQLLPYCDTAHVTKIDFEYEADSYFPNLDEMPDWKVTAESEEQTYFDLEYTFVKYERVK